MTFLKVLLEALFGAVITGLRAWQADKKLEALGYAKAQRDGAVEQIKAVDAVVAAQQRMAAVPAADRDAAVERLRDGKF